MSALRMLWILCVLALSLSGCGADVDVILQNDSADTTETTEAEAVIAEDPSEAEEETAGDSAEDAAAEAIFVYICGAVERPGVYELPDESRIWEVVEMAGGLKEDADERSVNLAEILTDGEMVFVPTVEESEAGVTAAVGSDPGGASSGTAAKVNINTAGIAELTTLNGIGEAKAAAIVAYREEHGFFRSPEEIMEVSGIGEGTYDKIKDDITI